ncbi:MAG: hypothetical protein SV375_02565 [Thermodesulfobacteriota bacterium]|nr:hypothetical protein [Thermodesulfobacteriota bacterium]
MNRYCLSAVWKGIVAEVLSSDVLKEEASFLADLIIHKYTSENGGLFEKVDVREGKAVVSECAVDELGDYIQYIIYLGILTSNSHYVDWAINNMALIARNYQSEKGLLYNSPQCNPVQKNLLSLNNADTLTGLVSSYIYTDSYLLKAIIVKFVNGTLRYFINRNYLTYGYLLGDRFRLSISSLLFAAYFIEETLYFMEYEGDWHDFNKIKDVIDANLSNPYFLKYGIFQARIPLGMSGAFWHFFYRFFKRDSLDKTFLVKDNIYLIFALLKYYAIVEDDDIRDVIFRTYDKLLAAFTKDDLVYNCWIPERGCVGGPSPLALSHSIIELQLDLYHQFNDRNYLRQAVKLTERWLERQSSLGVINEGLSDDEHYALLDPNVDFAINLVKLSEKTGHTRYMEKAFEIGKGLIEYFKDSAGYHWRIDTINGRFLHTTIETKYLGLLLKLFLVLMEANNKQMIFENYLLRNLARDR